MGGWVGGWVITFRRELVRIFRGAQSSLQVLYLFSFKLQLVVITQATQDRPWHINLYIDKDG